MVAELKKEIDEMKGRLAAAEDKITKTEKKVNELEEEVQSNHQSYLVKVATMEDKFKEVENAKANLIDVIGPKFQELRKAADDIINDAKTKFTEQDNQIGQLMKTANQKFDEADVKYNEMNEKISWIFTSADQRLRELQEAIKMVDGNGNGGAGHKKIGLLPDKMMLPKVFNDDIMQWNKWKQDVAKYFDESKEGIKNVMEQVANLKNPVTSEVLKEAAQNYPQVLSSVEQWKHLYRALEKLTDGEAAKIISTVKDENGFEAWRQLHLRFEPELEAQRNVVLTDLHNITPAKNIDETRSKMVELKVRIAKAENILHMEVQEMQKMTALLQIIDPITRQHTATMGLKAFDEFYTKAMLFANTNATIYGGTKEDVKSLDAKEKDSGANIDYDQNYDYDQLNAFGKGGYGGCNICGDVTHWARECSQNPKGKGKETQVYSCSECDRDIQSSHVEHQVWGNPHESVYEFIPYCPHCESKPGPLGNPITLKQARAWPEP